TLAVTTVRVSSFIKSTFVNANCIYSIGIGERLKYKGTMTMSADDEFTMNVHHIRVKQYEFHDIFDFKN
ncbi:hypothetical protein, partial [Pedobacter sp. BMA]|uniref:hypothetical protein n=1 Tax=Pedobacter sp. BMA TaxID=1663685 RepID=UPI000649DCC9